MLYLVDASIYVFHGWLTRPPGDLDARGEPAQAVTGFLDTLLDIRETRRASRLACAFDTSRDTSRRREIHAGYKAHRPPAPPALRRQFERCRACAEALGIACFASRRVEADDIIGMLANDGRIDREPVTIVTGDKDLAQFVGASDFTWDPRTDRALDARGIAQRFGVRPAQIPDWLALAGDATDGIPGVPGIGKATAARLLRHWGALDVLFANLEKVARMRFRGAPRIAALLVEHEKTVRLARRLTGLIEDPAIIVDRDALAWRLPSDAALETALRTADCTDAQIRHLRRRVHRCRVRECVAAPAGEHADGPCRDADGAT